MASDSKQSRLCCRTGDKGKAASGKAVQKAARVLRERRALQSFQKSKSGISLPEVWHCPNA